MVTATAVRRRYLMHGVTLDVSSAEPVVSEAMDLRFRDFRHDAAPATAAEVRFELAIEAGCSGDAEEPVPPDWRPVYDTPFGTLQYLPDSDVIGGELGGVHLRCEPGRGTCMLRGSTLTGRQLYLATHPLATVALIELLERRGLHSLHAACVAPRGGHGVLIAGISGAGKSTLALALARARVPFLSDDIVFLLHPHSGAAGVRALGFADTVGLTGFAAERFPELRDCLAEPPDPGFPKRLGRIEELFGVPAVPACEPRALVFPEVAPGERSLLEPLDSGEALLRLVPDVLVTDSDSTQAHLSAIAALLDQVSCYSLRSGADIERSVELVSELV